MDIYLDRDLYCEHFEVCILSRDTQVSTCPSAHTFHTACEYKSPSVRGSSLERSYFQ